MVKLCEPPKRCLSGLYRFVDGSWTIVVVHGEWWKKETLREETQKVGPQSVLPDDSWKGHDVPCKFTVAEGKAQGGLYYPYTNPKEKVADADADGDDCINFGYRVGDLRRAFNKLHDRQNWKNPIDAVIPSHEFALCDAATCFMTSGALSIVEHLEDGNVRVQSAGYYANVGS
jgi:hypothetical protein